MRLQFKLNGSKLTERYVLHARAKAAEDHKGFSQADVLYLLMPDRFANGDTGNDVVKGMPRRLCDRSQPSLRHGGDLAGISRHLDYFTDLGVTALWFTPILENDAPSFEQKSSSYHAMPRLTTTASIRALAPMPTIALDPRLPRARTEGRHGHDLQPLQQLPSLAAGQPVPRLVQPSRLWPPDQL